MTGDAQLSDEECVERRRERLRHLESDGDSATGKGKHYDVVAATIASELDGQSPPGVASVPEEHGALLPGHLSPI